MVTGDGVRQGTGVAVGALPWLQVAVFFKALAWE